jgi:hypothetical protein
MLMCSEFRYILVCSEFLHILSMRIRPVRRDARKYAGTDGTGKYAGRDEGSAALSGTGVQSPSRSVCAPGFETGTISG